MTTLYPHEQLLRLLDNGGTWLLTVIGCSAVTLVVIWTALLSMDNSPQPMLVALSATAIIAPMWVAVAWLQEW